MKRILMILPLLLVACGRQEAKGFEWPFEPSTGTPTVLVPRPPTSEVSLRYTTNGIDCEVAKTVNTPDLGVIYQRITDEVGNATFSRQVGHPYPEFVFVIVIKGALPAEAGVGFCDWALPESI